MPEAYDGAQAKESAVVRVRKPESRVRNRIVWKREHLSNSGLGVV